MSNESSPEQTSETANRRRVWATAGLTLGAIAALAAAGGAWWLWVFVYERLSPWVSDLLTETLDRPVNLGEVERVSLTGIQFGPSAIPPTETDPDELYVERINVTFNPLQLLRRQISPQITLVGVRAYLEQNEQGQWVDVELDLPEKEEGEEEPRFQVNPTVGIRDSEVILLPYLGPDETPIPLTIGNINGEVAVTRVEVNDPRDQAVTLEAQHIDLNLSAEPEQAGKLLINGEVQQLDYGDDSETTLLDSLDANLAVQAQQLDLAVLSPAILASVPQDLPLSVLSGILNGNLEADLTPLEAPRLTGTARLNAGEIALDALPNSIDNISAQARFQGNRVALENVTAQYANLSARAGGLIDARNGYDLTGEIAPFDLATLVEELDLDLPVEADGTFRAEATVTGPLADPKVTGKLLSTEVTTIDKVQFASIATELVYTPAALVLSSLEVTPLDGGSLTGSGAYTFGDPAELALQFQGRALPADAIGRAYGLPDTITLGAVALDGEVTGPLDDLRGIVSWQAPEGTYPTRGTAEIVGSTVRVRDAVVAVAGGTIAGSGTLSQGRWDADLIAQGIQLGEFSPALQGGTVAGNAQLAGSLDDLSLQGIRGRGDVTASLRGGTLNGQVNLASGLWDADVQTRNFPVAQFTPGVPISTVSADARLSGRVDDFSPAAIQADGTVTAAIAGGTVTSDISLENGFWQADGQARDLQLGQLATDLQGTGSGNFQLAGSLDNLSPTGIRGRANLVLSDGLATAASFAPQLDRVRSPLTASLAWDGRQLQINSLEAAGLYASGTLTPQLSGPGAPSIAAIDLALSTRDYALAALPIPLPPVLALEGQATFDGRLTGAPADLSLVGSLELDDLALNDLVFDPVMAGEVNFSSQEGVTVTLLGQQEGQDEISVNYALDPRQLDFRVRASDAIAIGETEGDLLHTRLYDFPISVLNIPPADVSPYGTLRGNVSFATATINLRDATTVGQLDVENLGIGYFSVDRLYGGFAYANGVASFHNGEIRMVDRNARGEILATRTYDLSGRYSLTQSPQLQVSLSTEEGQLRDILEVMKIQELADFGRGFIPGDGFIPDSQEEAETLLATTPAGDPNGTLLNQLRRLAEITERTIQDELQKDTATLPPLAELQGAFSGEINLSATLPEDLTVTFDITGDKWVWGPDLQADSVLAQGRYQNGLIAFTPLRFSSTEANGIAYIALFGEFSIDPEDQLNRVMELEVANLPADKIQNIANIPFDVGGKLNGTATLRGRFVDPDLVGRFQLANGTLNNTPIERAYTTFTYGNARLGLDAELLLIGADDPLDLSARIPYQLPFVAEPPTDRSYAINANVRDEGLALLNLFTQQVVWESGQGEVLLELEGNLDRAVLPEKFNGLILLRDASISFDALPTPMTGITGQIRLDPLNLAIVVERLKGEFSDGELTARGSFPLFDPLPLEDNPEDAPPPAPDSPPTPEEAVEDTPAVPAEAPFPAEEETPAPEIAATPATRPVSQIPLSIALDNIALNLKGLYNGQVNGQLVLRGSALRGPKLGGEIDLSEGVITIPEGSDQAESVPEPSTAASGGPLFRFEDLRIVLAEDIRIVLGVLLDVEARGGLRLDGPLDNLLPSGTIRLPRGRVGLFAASLRLAGENDRAEFRGNFDPILDITLQTSLPDASDTGIEPTTSPFPRNEVPDNTARNIGLTQQGNRLVRINARYNGPASELANITTDSRNLELTSSPVRSTREIITLLSGNVVGALGSIGNGGGDTFQGVATLAGSALLGTLRDFLGDTVPLSEFRLFQVSESTGQVNESQDIGGEIGFDVTSNISVSILKVLTNDTPFQFNARYRLSDQFTLRGTTSYEDFQDRTGVLLEYETRF